MKFMERRFMDPPRRMKSSQFDQLRPPAGAIVFLGDSLTEWGAWQEWFPGTLVVNRGIGGDTTEGLLNRLDAAIHEPAAVLLLVGTNDLALRIPADDIMARHREIIEQIGIRAPEARLTVQSVMPRQRKFQERIQALNENLERLAEKAGAAYLDQWPLLDDGTGQLKSGYTEDGLHLNGTAYREWAALLAPIVQESARPR